jgi:repressor LexA
VHKHIENLRKKGLVRKSWNTNRSLELTPAATGIRAIRLPLAGRVAAGRPIEAIEQREMIAVPESMTGKGDCFVLQVRGDSMIEEHIRDGDYVVVEKRARVRNGEVVVALVDDAEAILKSFHRDGARIRLQPANRTMEPMILPSDRVRVQGVVIGLLRRY